jgi:hypothetical protein
MQAPYSQRYFLIASIRSASRLAFSRSHGAGSSRIRDLSGLSEIKGCLCEKQADSALD